MEDSKIQRREFYRIERILPIEFERSDTIKTIREFAETLNISGTGIAFDHNCILEAGDKIKVFIEIEGKKIETFARIIARNEQPENSKHKYRYRITFINIKPKFQDIILDYVWREQLKKA